MSGTPAAGGLAPEPPSTNRGVLRPDDRVQGGIDYLKLTVWAPIPEVRRVLELGVLDRYGWSPDPYNPSEEWTTKIATGRAEEILDAGCLAIVRYRDEVIRGEDFCSVEIKGAGCAHLGNGGVRQVMTDLKARFRVRASRVDVMAHTEHFSPATAHDAVKACDYCSRTALHEKFAFTTSPEGDTLYLGVESKKSGGMKRSGERMLRIYDRRGPTRVELQLTGPHAHGGGGLLSVKPVEEWPALIRAMIRDFCDFVDRDSNERVARCVPLPWWDAFTNGAEKISVRPTDDPAQGTIVGMVDGTLQRYAGKLYAATEAYGADWIIARIERHGKLRRAKVDDHDDLVAEMLRYKGSGWAGIPGYDDEVPI